MNHPSPFPRYTRAQLTLQLQQNTNCGPFKADLLDMDHKILIDIDAPNRPVNRAVKHRVLTGLGWKCTSINYWRWRQCQTDEQQQQLCETVLDGLLFKKQPAAE